MASINKVILIGRLGKDPEVRFTPGGQAVANFSIATTDRWKNKQSGAFEERTEWHNIVVWGKTAELCKEYLAKGRQVYLEGRLQTRAWTDKEGHKRYTTEVVAQTVQFLDSRGERSTAAGASPQSASSGSSSSGPPEASGGMTESDAGGPPPFSDDDDIPF
jgi:single-strand DNA-binding protein